MKGKLTIGFNSEKNTCHSFRIRGDIISEEISKILLTNECSTSFELETNCDKFVLTSVYPFA